MSVSAERLAAARPGALGSYIPPAPARGFAALSVAGRRSAISIAIGSFERSAAILASGPAGEAEAGIGTNGATRVGGTLTQSAGVGGGVAVAARGPRAEAIASIGGIEQLQAGGSVRQTTDLAGDVLASADGQEAFGCASVGRLGTAAC